MSWVEAFGLAGVDVSTPGVADYARGAIIQWGVGQGLSQNGIERQLVDAGVGVTAVVQRGMIQAEQMRQSASLTSTQLNVDYSTGELAGPVPPANWTGQYVHQVTMTYREPVGSGVYELHTRTVGIKAGTPLTPFSAIQAAMDVITSQPGLTGSPDMPTPDQVLMSQLTGTWYDTQGRALPAAGSIAG